MVINGKMSPADRAKQFMPFDPLKGFREALKQKEKIIVDKVELSDEAKEELDRVLHQINKNDMVTVVYFKDHEYLQITGLVSRFDVSAKILKVINTKIKFDDIYKIRKE